MQDIDLTKFMKATELAKLLDVHITTVHRWIMNGHFADPRKCVGRWYLLRSEVAALMKRPDRTPPKLPRGQAAPLEDWEREVLKRAGI